MDTQTKKTFIGIGITTTPNRTYLEHTLAEWRKRLPEGARIEVYNDQDMQGISMAKNKLLEMLDDCDHIFLADDDTYPITDDWYKPYIESSQPHLQYNFTTGPSHWPIKVTNRYAGHVAYDKSRGCLLYVERRVLDIVGGMHNVFGKHGHEHEDWSQRIYKAGLTRYPYQDVDSIHFYCIDQDTYGTSSVVHSDHQGWRHIKDNDLPLYADYRYRGIPICVARRNDGGHRDRLWRFLKQSFWLAPPVLFEGYHKDGPFNRSLGLNIAATLAGNWDVAIFIDSDAYILPETLYEAVTMARETQKMVSPFTRVVELNHDTTAEILESHKLLFDPTADQIEKVRTEPTQTQSLIVVVPRNVFEQIGGFDEGFVGWGGEDNAFWRAAQIIGGEVIRLQGDVFHLWHEPASREHQPQNGLRWRRYQQARTRDDLEFAKRG